MELFDKSQSSKSQSRKEAGSVLYNRRLLACRECGWVHYIMTPEEKAHSDQFLTRYQLSKVERQLYESAFRQCLRCESPADAFRTANENDIVRATGHMVTPVFVEADVGMH